MKPTGELLMACLSTTTLKRALLFFWAAWLTVVFLTNALDGLKALGLLAESWPLASGNYRFVAETTARYGSPGWLNGLLFFGVVAWEGLAAALFWRAGWMFRDNGGRGSGATRIAFAVSLGLWAAFLLADEVLIAYAVEATHLRLFTAQLVTLLAVELLPDLPPPAAGSADRDAEGPTSRSPAP
jgi:hypothetical protein